MTGAAKNAKKRSTYRHGDLRNALLQAGIDLARDGGPDAVVLRETTRRAGVAPNAAYRHFADRNALLHAVSQASMSRLAVAMEEELAQLPPMQDKSLLARAHLRAVGEGYLRFAQAQPGLFRAAFSVPEHLEEAADSNSAGNSGMTPFQLLSSALDELVDAGVMPSEQREGTEFLAWSAVHGFAMLLIDGPLREFDQGTRRAIAERLLHMVDQGLRSPAASDQALD